MCEFFFYEPLKLINLFKVDLQYLFNVFKLFNRPFYLEFYFVQEIHLKPQSLKKTGRSSENLEKIFKKIFATLIGYYQAYK